jgi:Ca2+-transporting ATPase
MTIEVRPTSAYQQPIADVLEALTTDSRRGLSPSEVQTRLARYGRNELPTPPETPLWRRFLAQFADPLTGLLLVATVVSFIAWIIERDTVVPYESITILVVVLINGLLGFFQEYRAEQAVAALKAMSAATARVVRDGMQQIIPAAEVVPGDILLIEEGDTLPADGRVIESISMRVAESALTGESAPVSKETAQIESEAGIGDQINMVFSSTAVAAGRGRAVVTATGAQTEIGRIAGSLQETTQESTPLQKELDRTGRLLGMIVIGIAIIISITILLVDQVRDLADLVDILLLAVSLAVAAVPEGLTAITTIVLSLGMQRMAERHVIVRRLSAVETLGSTTVICSDKTGTLTKNEMTVRTVISASGRVDLTGSGYDPSGELHQNGQAVPPVVQIEVERILRAAYLANNANLLHQNGQWTIQGDPTEAALLVAARKAGVTPEHVEVRFPRVGEVPFTSERKMMSTAHADQQKERLIVFAKGAPDVLLSACNFERVGDDVQPLTSERRTLILNGVEELATAALRTLGVAYRSLPANNGKLPITDAIEQELVFLGVVGMIDPPRPEAHEAVKVAQQAGVRVVMITGDHPVTGAAIASELGIVAPGAAAVRGAELQALDDNALRSTVRQRSLYARVAPEHKLRIVQALRANGDIAAMTGDGVNDAPALKAADIGVAMGITGTDVSKGAADMILTDDNFASIVAAIAEGRSIFANIQKFLRYLLSSNIGEVLVMFLGVIFADLIGLVPEDGATVVVPLLAVQILWINLLTDSAPALALGVDPVDPDLMQKPPRDPHSRVITGWMWFDIGFVGIVMALGTLLVIDLSLPGGMLPGSGDLTYAQTMTFTTLVLFQLFNVFNARSDERSALRGMFNNRWIWVAIAISALLQVAVIYVPFLQNAFGTVPLSGSDWLLCTVVASSVLILREAVKLTTALVRRLR